MPPADRSIGARRESGVAQGVIGCSRVPRGARASSDRARHCRPRGTAPVVRSSIGLSAVRRVLATWRLDARIRDARTSPSNSRRAIAAAAPSARPLKAVRGLPSRIRAERAGHHHHRASALPLEIEMPLISPSTSRQRPKKKARRLPAAPGCLAPLQNSSDAELHPPDRRQRRDRVQRRRRTARAGTRPVDIALGGAVRAAGGRDAVHVEYRRHVDEAHLAQLAPFVVDHVGEVLDVERQGAARPAPDGLLRQAHVEDRDKGSYASCAQILPPVLSRPDPG